MAVGSVCVAGHRHPSERPFGQWAYSKGLGHFIPFDLTGWSIERTGVARCTSNETCAAGTEAGSADTL
jgi:hypothetical protein